MRPMRTAASAAGQSRRHSNQLLADHRIKGARIMDAL